MAIPNVVTLTATRENNIVSAKTSKQAVTLTTTNLLNSNANANANSITQHFISSTEDIVYKVNYITKLLQTSLIETYTLINRMEKSLAFANWKGERSKVFLNYSDNMLADRISRINDVFGSFEILSMDEIRYNGHIIIRGDPCARFRYCIENQIQYAKELRRELVHFYASEVCGNSIQMGLFRAYFKLLDAYLKNNV